MATYTVIVYDEDDHFIAMLGPLVFTHDLGDIQLQVPLSADLISKRWYDVEIIFESISVTSVRERFGKLVAIAFNYSTNHKRTHTHTHSSTA